MTKALDIEDTILVRPWLPCN